MSSDRGVDRLLHQSHQSGSHEAAFELGSPGPKNEKKTNPSRHLYLSHCNIDRMGVTDAESKEGSVSKGGQERLTTRLERAGAIGQWLAL